MGAEPTKKAFTKKSDTLRETIMLFCQPQEESSIEQTRRTVKSQPIVVETKGACVKLVKKE
jgi:hypothetical protein